MECGRLGGSGVGIHVALCRFADFAVDDAGS